MQLKQRLEGNDTYYCAPELLMESTKVGKTVLSREKEK
jgi:hypothetical protein